MKVCTVEHEVPTFGTIPVGSLWDDESPYVLDENAACFDTVDVEPYEAPEVPVRKFQPKGEVD